MNSNGTGLRTEVDLFWEDLWQGLSSSSPERRSSANGRFGGNEGELNSLQSLQRPRVARSTPEELAEGINSRIESFIFPSPQEIDWLHDSRSPAPRSPLRVGPSTSSIANSNDGSTVLGVVDRELYEAMRREGMPLLEECSPRESYRGESASSSRLEFGRQPASNTSGASRSGAPFFDEDARPLQPRRSSDLAKANSGSQSSKQSRQSKSADLPASGGSEPRVVQRGTATIPLASPAPRKVSTNSLRKAVPHRPSPMEPQGCDASEAGISPLHPHSSNPLDLHRLAIRMRRAKPWTDRQVASMTQRSPQVDCGFPGASSSGAPFFDEDARDLQSGQSNNQAQAQAQAQAHANANASSNSPSSMHSRPSKSAHLPASGGSKKASPSSKTEPRDVKRGAATIPLASRQVDCGSPNTHSHGHDLESVDPRMTANDFEIARMLAEEEERNDYEIARALAEHEPSDGMGQASNMADDLALARALQEEDGVGDWPTSERMGQASNMASDLALARALQEENGVGDGFLFDPTTAQEQAPTYAQLPTSSRRPNSGPAVSMSPDAELRRALAESLNEGRQSSSPTRRTANSRSTQNRTPTESSRARSRSVPERAQELITQLQALPSERRWRGRLKDPVSPQYEHIKRKTNRAQRRTLEETLEHSFVGQRGQAAKTAVTMWLAVQHVRLRSGKGVVNSLLSSANCTHTGQNSEYVDGFNNFIRILRKPDVHPLLKTDISAQLAYHWKNERILEPSETRALASSGIDGLVESNYRAGQQFVAPRRVPVDERTLELRENVQRANLRAREDAELNHRPVHEVMGELLIQAGRSVDTSELKAIGEEPCADMFARLLSRLPETAIRAGSDGVLDPALLQQINHEAVIVIESILMDSGLRKSVFAIAHTALGSCDDNVAQGFSQILQLVESETMAKQVKNGLIDHRSFIQWAKNEFRKDKLDSLVNNHIKTRIESDLISQEERDKLNSEPVEVMLHAQVEVGKLIDLPTSTRAHLAHPSASALTEADINNFVAQIKSAERSDALLEFLLKNDTWKSAMEKLNEGQFTKILEKYENDDLWNKDLPRKGNVDEEFLYADECKKLEERQKKDIETLMHTVSEQYIRQY